MDFDFYAQYQQASTLELLLILKQPDKYQPVALEAARRVLNERGVSEQDEKQAAEHVEAQLLAKVKKKDKEKTLSELLDPLTEPTHDSTLDKGIKIGLIVLTIYYLWCFYQASTYIYYDLVYGDPGVDLSIVLQWLTILYAPLVCYLLWKRHPWGWRLLLGENILALTGSIFPFILNARWEYMDIFGMAITAFILALRVAICVFAWRDDVSAAFSINKAAKAKALKTILILAAVIVVMILIAMSDVKIIS